MVVVTVFLLSGSTDRVEHVADVAVRYERNFLVVRKQDEERAYHHSLVSRVIKTIE